MPLLADVLTWSERQALWVRDALRRVFSSDALSIADYDELYTLLLATHGVVFEGQPAAVPLAAVHLPAIPADGVTNIAGIFEMHHVNRYPADSSIEFSPVGLTIVYGENGTGKSGVARVLKQVCRARKRDKVLGNVYAADFAAQVPRAVIRYQHEGQNQQISWTMADAPPEVLQSVMVFDGACSIDYINAEGDASFQPFGLSNLEALAGTVFTELSRRIDTAIRNLDCDTERFARLAPATTAAGALVSNITIETDVAEVRRLGTISAEETARLAQLVTILAETNAEPKAQALEGLAARLLALHNIAIRARAFVTDAAITKWRELVDAAGTTKRHRDEAEALLEGGVLPGTGSETWRAMFLAAKAYSLQEAYPHSEAPNVEEGAKCVLCQTELDAPARDRLASFNAFVISDAATAATAAENAVTQAFNSIEAADLSIPVEEVLEREIQEHAQEIMSLLAIARSEFHERRTWMVEQRDSKTWDGLPALSYEPSVLATIEAKIAGLRTLAATYRNAVDEQARKVLEQERDELEARVTIEPHVESIVRAIDNLKQRDVLKRCKDSLDTTSISRQIGVLAVKYITDALAADMVEELKELGVMRIAHAIKKRIDRGRTMMSLVLEGTNAKAAVVLSEGEQRVAAFALFLAELKQSGSRSGLIVDDPVSSLDHRYRHRVATRLVNESGARQVIVLTHDPVFLSALLTRCEYLGQAPTVLTIDWSNDAPGRVQSGLPWMNKSVSERLHSLKADQARVAAAWGENPSEEAKREMAEIYARVRGTLERVIRESILNKSIRPFDDRVQIERVAAIPGFSEVEFDQVNAVYLRCNPAMDGHDSSGEGARDIPTPVELADDIAAMEQLVANATARRKAREKQDEAARQGARREG